MVDQGTYPNRDKPGGYDAYTTVMADFIRDVRKDRQADVALEVGERNGCGPRIDLDGAEVGLGQAVLLEVVGAQRARIAAGGIHDHQHVQRSAARLRQGGQEQQRGQTRSKQAIHMRRIVAKGLEKFKPGGGCAAHQFRRYHSVRSGHQS